jgi:acid phosphatase (class A)
MNRFKRIDARCGILSVLAFILIMAGCAGGAAHRGPAPVADFLPGMLMGYLPLKELPNSAILIPPPPAEGSAALAFDEEYSKRSLALRGTPRWDLAIVDDNLKFPKAADTFSCALNAPITEKETPYLYMLLRRSLTDAAMSTYGAKNKYQRPRPFLLNKEANCSSADQTRLAKDGSYPSGHTAIGWAWALILAEISPERTDAILARGRAFGDSRNICNVHWRSDVIEGRLLGAATAARLHGDPGFLADLAAAKTEVAALRAKGAIPMGNCAAEAAALAIQP